MLSPAKGTDNKQKMIRIKIKSLRTNKTWKNNKRNISWKQPKKLVKKNNRKQLTVLKTIELAETNWN